MSVTQSLPKVSDVINAALFQALTDFRVCMPGTISSYNPATGLAEISPDIGDRLFDKRQMALPQITDVPIVFPQGEDWGFTMPIERGMKVVVFISDRSLDEWQAVNPPIIPADMRSHSLKDAFAIPGAYPAFKNIRNDNNAVKMRYGSNVISVDKNGKMKLTASGVDVLSVLSDALNTLANATVDIETLQFTVDVKEALNNLKSMVDSIR